MVPAPTTPTLSTCLGFASDGAFPAARSAKKIWRSAFASVVPASFRNVSRSSFLPSAKGMPRVLRIRPNASSGAVAPRACFRIEPSILSRFSSTPTSALDVRMESRREVISSLATSSANEIAAVTTSPSATLSTRPSLRAFSAEIGLPPQIISAASTAPTRRGSLCVPPAPGTIPRLVSGSPNLLPATAMR